VLIQISKIYTIANEVPGLQYKRPWLINIVGRGTGGNATVRAACHQGNHNASFGACNWGYQDRY
jgi:hypothetical protein